MMKPNSAIRCTLASVLLFLLCQFPITALTDQRERNLQSNPIVRLELINALNDIKIADLVDGQVFNIQDVAGLTSPNFNINAVTTGSVSSVVFGWNGNPNVRTENAAPYAFCGNNGPNFYKCSTLTYGVHTVTATAFASGITSPTVSVQFTIVANNNTSPSSPVAPPTKTVTSLAPVAAPVAVPVPVPTPVFAAPVVVPVPVPVPTPVFVAPVAVPVPTPVAAPVTPPVAVPMATAVPQLTLPAIHTLRLMFTGVNPSAAVFNLTFDAVNVVDLQALNLPSGKFNIDVLVGTGVKSVSFSNGRTETAAPLAYCGNFGNNFYDCDNLVEGANVTVTVTAYPEGGGLGNPILTRSTTIHIVRPLPPVAPTPPTLAPVPAPIIPPVPGCAVPKVSIVFQ